MEVILFRGWTNFHENTGLVYSDNLHLPLGTKNTRRLILGLCALIVLLGLFMELSGAIIGESVKMGLSKR